MTGSFSGTTRQKQSISFHVGHGQVTKLQFRVKDACPNGQDVRDPRLQLPVHQDQHQFHKFDGKFESTTTNAQVEITGTVSKQAGQGKLAEIRYDQVGAPRLRRRLAEYTVHKQ